MRAVLIGFKHCGKTSVGTQVAKELNEDFRRNETKDEGLNDLNHLKSNRVFFLSSRCTSEKERSLLDVNEYRSQTCKRRNETKDEGLNLFIDTDKLIEQTYQAEKKVIKSAREIYLEEGEIYFRHLEKRVITRLDESEKIIATGGGSLLDKDNVLHLKQQGPFIYLYATFETLLKRYLAHPVPAFLDPKNIEENFKDIYAQRENIYSKHADFKILTDDLSINDITQEVIKLLRNIHGK